MGWSCFHCRSLNFCMVENMFNWTKFASFHTAWSGSVDRVDHRAFPYVKRLVKPTYPRRNITWFLLFTTLQVDQKALGILNGSLLRLAISCGMKNVSENQCLLLKFESLQWNAVKVSPFIMIPFWWYSEGTSLKYWPENVLAEILYTDHTYS
jgi:hypothetical protein